MKERGVEGKRGGLSWRARAGVVLILFVMLPVALLCALEGGLRVAGFGHSTRLFARTEANGESYYLANREFYQQFYALGLDPMQWYADQYAVPAKKGEDVFRVFVFGGSAAAGIPPDSAYSFWRTLEVMLEASHPSKRFEFYCVAMPGASSNSMRPAALACGRLDPDLFVVLMGNNEVCGPFGPATQLGQSRLWGPWVVRLAVWLTDLRLTQVLGRFGEAEAGMGSREAHNALVADSFAPDSPKLARTMEVLEANLRDICEAGIKGGGDVIVCAVGSNIRDWPPSLEGNTADMDLAAYYEGNLFSASGFAHERAGQYGEALEDYGRALEESEESAPLAFRMGRCCWALGRYDEAREHFLRAREREPWPTRSGDRVNEVVRRVVSSLDGRGVHLAEVAPSLVAGSPHEAPGMEFFYDGVHMTFEGNYRAAKAVYDAAVRCVEGGAPEAAPLSMEACKERLALTPGILAMHAAQYSDAYAGYTMEELDRSHCQAVLAKRRDEALALAGLSAVREDAEADFEAYAAALKYDPRDYVLGLRYIQALSFSGKPEEALAHAEKLAEWYPCSREALALRARMRRATGDAEGAQAAYQAVLAVFPEDGETYFDLASVHRLQGSLEEAMTFFRKGVFLDPASPRIHVQKAELCRARGDVEGAISAYREAMKCSPYDPAAYVNLGRLLLGAGRKEEALTVLEKGAEVLPENGQIRGVWARALFESGSLEEALLRVNEAMGTGNADPYGAADAACLKGDILRGLGRREEAAAAYRWALEQQPGFSKAQEALDEMDAAPGGDGANS